MLDCFDHLSNVVSNFEFLLLVVLANDLWLRFTRFYQNSCLVNVILWIECLSSKGFVVIFLFRLILYITFLLFSFIAHQSGLKPFVIHLIPIVITNVLHIAHLHILFPILIFLLAEPKLSLDLLSPFLAYLFPFVPYFAELPPFRPLGSSHHFVHLSFIFLRILTFNILHVFWRKKHVFIGIIQDLRDTLLQNRGYLGGEAGPHF